MEGSVAAEQTLRLLENLKRLKNVRVESEEDEVVQLLQSLLQLNYETPFLTSDIGADLLRLCLLHCNGRPPSCEIAKLTKQLIWTLQTSQGNQLELDDNLLLQLIQFCLREVRNLEETQLLQSFHSLGTLTYQNSHRLQPVWAELFSTLEWCLAVDQPKVACRHSALKVLQALTIRREDDEAAGYLSSDQAESICSLIIAGVANIFVTLDEMMFCKVLQASVKILLNMATAKVQLPTAQIGFLLGWLRHLTFFGFPGYAQRPIKNFDLFPSPVCHQLPQVDLKQGGDVKDSWPGLPLPRDIKSRARKKRTRRENQNAEARSSTSAEGDIATLSPSRSDPPQSPWTKTDSSDSEVSDAEGPWRTAGTPAVLDPQTLNLRIKASKAKVRQLAYDGIRLLLLNMDQKERFGYVLNFLPQQSGSLMRSTEHTLVLSILKDPSALVRSAAINVLKDFVTYSKTYLILACESTHQTSFTSLSELMAVVISELHRALHLALLAEQIPIFLVPLLGCLSLLIGASPYSRLKPVVVTDMCSDLRTLLQNSKYEQVRVGALTCLGGLVSYKPEHPEIVRCLGLDGDHWLERLCVEKLSPTDADVNQVKLEILQMLSLLVSTHFNRCTDHIDLYARALELSLADVYGPVRIHGMKLAAALAKQISDLLSETEDVAGKERLKGLGRKIWLECLFSGAMQRSLQNEQSDPNETEHSLRERQILQREAFLAMANIGADMWNDLPSRNQRFVVCILLSQLRQTTDDTAVAAVRTLAFFCTYPSMSQDVIFLQDVGELCVALLLKKITMTLRMKVSWALSNVCDALWTLRNSDPDRFEADISTEFYLSLLDASIRTYADKDSIRINAVRSIGILLGMATQKYLSTNEQLVQKAIDHLLKSAAWVGNRFVKAKWNACRAIGWILANAHIRKLVDVPLAMEALDTSLMTCINLKVQIACVSALDQLSGCDDIEPAVWVGAFTSLVRKANQVPSLQVDYKELKHLQNLKQQLALAMVAFIERTAQEGRRDHSEKLFSQIAMNREAVEELFRGALHSDEGRSRFIQLIDGSPLALKLQQTLPNLQVHLQQAIELHAVDS